MSKFKIGDRVICTRMDDDLPSLEYRNMQGTIIKLDGKGYRVLLDKSPFKTSPHLKEWYFDFEEMRYPTKLELAVE